MIRRAFNLVVSGLGLLQITSPLLHGAGAANSSGSLDEAFAGFLSAFGDLDWPRFIGYFAEEATAFHPNRNHWKRTDGVVEFQKAWAEVFREIRANSGHTRPPYMSLVPKDVQVKRLSQDVALVTFHLMSEVRLGRRTLVWQDVFGTWKIVHLHASNFDLRSA